MPLSNTIQMVTPMVMKSTVMERFDDQLSMAILQSIDMAAWTLTEMVGQMKETISHLTQQNIWIQTVTGPDSSDDFPFDRTQWKDTDGDGYGDNPQGNLGDVFPNDASRYADSDRDGIDDQADAIPVRPYTMGRR